MNEFIKLFIWAAVIGVVFAFIWRKGYLMRFSNYVLETRYELKKCTWPTLDELKGSTVVVVITIAILGIFSVCVDFVVSLLVRFIT